MDRLWSPWRYSYIRKGPQPGSCVFCEIAAAGRDEENFVLFRGEHNFVLLNLYPYTSGHLMIAPYEHVSTLEAARVETLEEMMRLTQVSEKHLRAAYQPAGLNVGLNIGEAAGAGIASHIHMHVLPRWIGDANFMTAIGETRVLPEELEATYQKLRPRFQESVRPG
jgi:ATP adenylyltransferase